MSFVVSSGTLLRHLRLLNGIVASNPIVPILENFKFEVGRGVLRTTASDLSTTIVAELAVESTTETSLAVPARILIEMLSNVPEQPVKLTVDEDTYSLGLKTDNGEFKISGENAVDFPKTPKLTGGQEFTISGQVLGRAVANTAFAASTDDMRPAMTGVFFQMDEEESNFVSTDGHRMVKYTRTDVKAPAAVSFIVPRKTLQFLKGIVPSDSTEIKVYFTSQSARFAFGQTEIYCRLIDERYPDYQAAIPAQNPNVILIDRLELLGAMKRVAVFTNKASNQVRFKLSENELTLSAEDVEYSNEGQEALQCEYTGEAMEIGFNARMVVEMLTNLDSNMVSIEMSAPTRPGLIKPLTQDDEEQTMMLVMPIMLSSYAPI